MVVSGGGPADRRSDNLALHPVKERKRPSIRDRPNQRIVVYDPASRPRDHKLRWRRCPIEKCVGRMVDEGEPGVGGEDHRAEATRVPSTMFPSTSDSSGLGAISVDGTPG